MKTASTKAFTLVELIVVITILAILATIGFLSLQGYTGDAKNATTKANVKSVAESMVNEAAISSQPMSNYLTTSNTNLVGGSGAVIAVYSGQTATGGTSYFAGKVSYSALRLDADKFEPVGKDFLAGVVGVQEGSRVRSAFQIAGTITNGSTDSAYVEGTYAKAIDTDVAGLISTDGTTTSIITNGGTVVPYASK